MADLFLKSVFIWFEHVQLIPLQICETPYKSLHGFKGGGRNRETYIFKILCLLSLLFMPIKSTILSQFDIDVDLPNAWILALMDRFLRAKLMPLNKPPVEVAEPNVHQMPLRGKPTKDPRYLPTTFLLSWAVVVVKWSACLPSTLTIRVWIPLMPTVFSVKFVFEKNKNKKKEAGVGSFLKYL